MSGSIGSQANFGSFIPTTNIWEIDQVQSIDIDPKLKELLVRIYQNINNISLSLNTRDAGYYVQQEFLNGQLFFADPKLNQTSSANSALRQIFRMVVNFGPLPNSTSISIPHGINIVDSYSFTRIYGAANSLDSSFIPLPYSSPTLNLNIELSVDQNYITITTDFDYTSYTKCYVILEYIKQ